MDQPGAGARKAAADTWERRCFGRVLRDIPLILRRQTLAGVALFDEAELHQCRIVGARDFAGN
jgi:hypothetical protein